MGMSDVTQPLTRLNYAYDLKGFFRFLITETEAFQGKKMSDFVIEDLEKVEVLDIELYSEWLNAGNSKSGKMRKLSALRSFFAFYFKKGEISRNVLPNVDLPKLKSKDIVRLDKDEVSKIIGGAKNGTDLTAGQRRFHNKIGFRDTVILTFFLSTGMRVSELVGLNVGDIDLKNSSFRITRKGGNETVLYMTQELCDMMREYLENANHNHLCTISDKQHKIRDSKAISGNQTRPLSNTKLPSDRPLSNTMPNSDRPLFISLKSERLGVRAVQNLVKKYASIAAPLKNISPHKLRSTFGTNLYRATGDIYAVADVLGHQNVNTTKKHYAAITDDIRRNAINQFKLDAD